MKDPFTWIPLYTEIADRLLEWENRQTELISFLEDLRSKGVKVTPLNDQDREGEIFLSLFHNSIPVSSSQAVKKSIPLNSVRLSGG